MLGFFRKRGLKEGLRFKERSIENKVGLKRG
jgi:hypothetical protein